ncbi:ATP synthase [Desulfonema ishimotonii]|uniref:ATP synthase n=1 Tax=Desulfonema ishimotonii TaxID=45657 RepID=A0A401FWZ3_9BACT|nr:AtpZ/AtpI family protein [Desulfonema ishimotonii]GBC61490.1 ATP synthase [Desulfonema ishimotonii]
MEKKSEETPERDFPDSVHVREQRMLRARKKGKGGIWFGLGTFGQIGWSVAIPTVAGIFLGIWIDMNWPSPWSWTLMLLAAGLAAGCANAWFWVQKERRAISRSREDNGEHHGK